MNLRLCLLLAVLGLCACAPAALEPPPPAPSSPGGATLALELAAQDDGAIVVDLRYARRPEQAGPRVVELYLGLSDNLGFAAAEPGEAAIRAGKQLTVQPGADGTLRTVLLSPSSVAQIDSGLLARYRLTRRSPGPARVEILDRTPVFAPVEANEGVVLGDPLPVGGR
ncbi:MAG: hypothetical protein FJ125_02705 [Deltaproteobacteria bacterium]|nr:hypothetical protein [Deltaproteobacteria bacterium]